MLIFRDSMQHADPNEFIFAEAAASTIGCSVATLWRLVAGGQLKRYKQHTRTVFNRSEVEKIGEERRRIR